MNPTSASLYARLTFDTIIIFLVFAWITIFLRLWVRVFITRNPGWDDWTMLITLCLFTCYCSFILVITMRSATANLMTPKLFLQTLVYIQLGEIFYILTTTLLKISLGLFFLRVLTKPWQLRVFYTILAVSAIYGVFYFLVAVFQCGNPARLAEGLLGSKKCLPSWFLLGTGYLYGTVNIIADWTFVLIPISILIDSDMDRRSKISVSIVMAFGAVGSISSILRCVYLKGLLFSGTLTTDAVKATLWATAEPGTGIIAASIAILRPLLRKVSGGVRDRLSEYSRSRASQVAPSKHEHTRMASESTIALTSRATAGNATKASVHSPREDDDVWDANITLGHAQIGKMVTVRMTSEGVPPPLPPKP